jgi:uncharacterized membrane protein
VSPASNLGPRPRGVAPIDTEAGAPHGAGHGAAPTRHLWWSMISRLRDAWEALNSSYWFLPAALGVGAFLLSLATLSVDRRLPQDWLLRLDTDALPMIQSEGARGVLTTVASSMITVAGVVFSLTLLVLTQASSQFGPRLLNNFMRDRTNQFVLGIFVATFVYALLVLRVVTGGDGDSGIPAFVPHLSMLVALVLTFFTVAVLVYFFHHIAQSVRVTHLLADVDDALRSRLEDLNERDPDEHGSDREEPEQIALAIPLDFRDDLGVVPAGRGGYLQAVDADGLVAKAAGANAVVRIVPVVGAFVMRGAPLAEVHPATAAGALSAAIHRAVALGPDRSLTQDLAFYFDEFLEIALRALSPSMNDPFTARSCIDRIGQGLLLLDRRRLPRQVHVDEDGVVRAFVPLQGKGALARHVLGELRRASTGHPFVTQHLLETLVILHRTVGSAAIRVAVDDELAAIVPDAESSISARDHARLRAMVAHAEAVEARDDAEANA